jgi:hypothetical protein
MYLAIYMNSLSVCFLVYVCTVCSALGASEAAPVPRLGTAPSSSAWTISVQYKSPNPAIKLAASADPAQAEWIRTHNPRVVAIRVVKAGENKKETFQYDNQTQVIQWVIGDTLVSENLQDNTLSPLGMKDSGAVLFAHDFDSLAWVDQAQYEGHRIFQGTDCCVYVEKAGDQGVEQTAFIDAKSGLPVGVQAGDTTVLYTFTPSSDAIEIPAKVAATIKAYIAAVAAASQKP